MCERTALYREKLEKKWQERRKKQQQQSLPSLPPQPEKSSISPAAPVGAARPPGLPQPPLQVASSTPTSMAAADADKNSEGMDDMQVFHFAAGGKRGAPRSPAAAKAIAAIRALNVKHAREGSPTKGMNPDAQAFHPPAAAAQSERHFGDAADFMRTFTWPASSHTNVPFGSGSRDADDARPSAPRRFAHAGMIQGSSEAG